MATTEDRGGSQMRRPHFFKVYLPGLTSDSMEIPLAFRRHMEADFRTCTLMGPSGNTWTVELVKNAEGRLYFEHGWKEFTRDHNITTGEFCVFAYEGLSRFRVMVFETTACEKESAFLTRPSLNNAAAAAAAAAAVQKTGDPAAEAENGLVASDDATGLASGKRLRRCKEEVDDECPPAIGPMMEKEGGSSPEASTGGGRGAGALKAGKKKKKKKKKKATTASASSRRRRSRGLLVSQRRPVSNEEIERAHRAANSFMSESPFHVMVMRKSGVYIGHSMPLPHSFSKRHLPKTAQKITLSTCSGTSWEVTFLPLKGTYILSAGWRQFSLDNCLEEDDACVFEVIKKDEIRVHIFRVVEETRPLVRTVVTSVRSKELAVLSQ